MAIEAPKAPLTAEQLTKQRDVAIKDFKELNRAVNVLIAAGFLSESEVADALSFVRRNQ